MANRLKSKGHMERMLSTNRILPVGTLKRKIIKQLFSGWIRQYVGEGRVLTLKLALQVVASLRNKFSMEKLGEEQRLCEAKRMQYLLKVARKRKLSNRVRSRAVSTMDTVDTVPMEAEDFWLAQDVQLDSLEVSADKPEDPVNDMPPPAAIPKKRNWKLNPDWLPFNPENPADIQVNPKQLDFDDALDETNPGGHGTSLWPDSYYDELPADMKAYADWAYTAYAGASTSAFAPSRPTWDYDGAGATQSDG